MKINLLIIVIVALISGCSYSTYYLQTGAKNYPSTNANDIKLYSDKPDKPFTAIGSVAADATDKNAAKVLLRRRAAEIGADAVIYVTLDNIATSTQRIGMNGVAVTFTH